MLLLLPSFSLLLMQLLEWISSQTVSLPCLKPAVALQIHQSKSDTLSGLIHVHFIYYYSPSHFATTILAFLLFLKHSRDAVACIPVFSTWNFLAPLLCIANFHISIKSLFKCNFVNETSDHCSKVEICLFTPSPRFPAVFLLYIALTLSKQSTIYSLFYSSSH